MKAELSKHHIASFLGLLTAFPISSNAVQLLRTGEIVKAVQGRVEYRSLISRHAQFSGGSNCDPLLCHTEYRCDEYGNCISSTIPFSYLDDPLLSSPVVPKCDNPEHLFCEGMDICCPVNKKTFCVAPTANNGLEKARCSMCPKDDMNLCWDGETCCPDKACSTQKGKCIGDSNEFEDEEEDSKDEDAKDTGEDDAESPAASETGDKLKDPVSGSSNGGKADASDSAIAAKKKDGDSAAAIIGVSGWKFATVFGLILMLAASS